MNQFVVWMEMGTIQKGLFVKKVLFTFSIILGLLLSTNVVRASHIMGSDIFWDCMGSDTFKITIRVYRDCKGVELLSTPFTLTSDTVMKSLSSSRTYLGDVTPVCDKLGCTGCSSSTCSYKFGVEAFDITSIVYLGDWRKSGFCNVLIKWQQCCRNKAITTGASDQNFYTSAQMNICLSSCDNSPRWSYSPFAIMCLGSNFQWIPGLMDLDMDTSSKSVLDSFAFSIDTPMLSATQKTKWNGGFSPTRPLQSLSFHLDSVFGYLSFRPTREQVSIMTIRVDQYRNGVKIGYMRREMQFVVVKCPTNIEPYISGVDGTFRAKSLITVDVKGCIGDTLRFKFTTGDIKPDTIKLWPVLPLPTNVKFTIRDSTSRQPVGEVVWVIDSSDMINSPHMLSFGASDNKCPVSAQVFRSFQVFIGSPTTYPTQFFNKIIDSTCGRIALWGGSTDSTINDLQQWYINDTLVGVGDSVVFDAGSLDTQFVKAVIKRNGCYRAFYDTVMPPSFRPIFVNSFVDTAMCSGSIYTKQIVGKGGSGKLKYSWDLKRGVRITSKTDSLISLKVLGSVNQHSSSVQLVVTDVNGCRQVEDLEVLVLETHNKNQLRDTLICGSDSFQIKLPYYQDSLGVWTGPGVNNGQFRSSLVKDGIHSLEFQYRPSLYSCVIDNATINFGKQVSFEYDSIVGTCLSHDAIPLQIKPSGGRWSGIGVFKDSLFKHNTSQPEQVNLSYSYETFYGCKDTAIVTIDIGSLAPVIELGSDTHLCEGGQPIEVSIVNANSGRWIDNPQMVEVMNNKWFVDETGLIYGSNQAVFHGVDTNYCNDYDTLTIEYLMKPSVAFSSAMYELCEGSIPVRLEISPDSAIVRGDSLIANDSGYYILPTTGMVGKHVYWGEVTGKNGCVGLDTAFVFIRDTVKRSFIMDTALCPLQEVPLAQFPDSGYWEASGPRLVEKSGSSWKVRPKKFHSGDYSVFFRRYIPDECYLYDTSIVSVLDYPALNITKDHGEICGNAVPFKLQSTPTGATWSGRGVEWKDGRYYFNPVSQEPGPITIYAEIQGKYCSNRESAKVEVIDYIYGGEDDTVCLVKDSIFYNFSNTEGVWSGHGTKGDPVVRFLESDRQTVYDYVVSGKGNEKCSTDTVRIYLGRKPLPDFSSDINSGQRPLEVGFYNRAQNAVFLKWYFGTGDSSLEKHPDYVYQDTGVYDVRLVCTDSKGFCKSEIIKKNMITVFENNSIQDGPTYLRIYPNPTSDKIMLSSSNKLEGLIYTISDVSGKTWSSGSISISQSTSLDVKHLPIGHYVLDLWYDGNRMRSFPFIKE